jgi:aquaporin Z
MGRDPSLRGRHGAPQPAPAPEGGLHWVEWGCELAGTAILVAGGLSAVSLDFGPGSFVAASIPSHSWRLLLTGVLFAGTASLVTVSPLGRRSGAHLNPAVTFAFWMRRHVHPSDLGGYVLSQCAGGLAGAAAVLGLWGARDARLGVTAPRPGLGDPAGAGVEALMTGVLVLVLLWMVSAPRRARWTPLVLWLVIAVLVWQGAPWTGTSLNPARSLGPAVVDATYANLWVYLLGPLAGAAAAVVVFDLLPGVETLTAKLYHDPSYPSTMRSLLPVS